MNKAELIGIIAVKLNMSRREADKVVNTVFDTITETLKKGEKVQMVGFGAFEVKNGRATAATTPGQTNRWRFPRHSCLSLNQARR
jgi:Bacterial nucleoid DNA-binding protein